jgi:hypothetical protein
VLILVLIFVLLFAALAVIFAGGTLFVQGNLYSEPTTGIAWRAPAAAAVLTLFYAAWAILDYRTLDPNRPDFPYDTIFRFSPTETKQVDRFVAKIGDDEKTYTRTQSGSFGSALYVDDKGRPFSRSTTEGPVQEIVVKDDKGEMHFKPKMTKEGGFKSGEAFPGFYQVDGRHEMAAVGQVSVFRWGLYVMNLFLNFVHFVLWFVLVWLVLRFQWTHALFGSVILWAVMTIIVVPMLLEKTQRVAQQKAGVVTMTPLQEPVVRAWADASPCLRYGLPAF